MTPDERTTLIARYQAGPAELEAAWNELPPEVQRWKPSPQDWSAHEIVVHCADSETYAATRIRLLVTSPTPLIVGYDQEQWVTDLGYEETPVETAFAVVSAVRAHTSLLLPRLTDAQWQAVGTHTDDGAFAASDWLEGYGNHLHIHAAQIRDNLARWHASR